MRTFLLGGVLAAAMVSGAWGDVFGTGANQFSMDFVTISGDTNPATGIALPFDYTFYGVTNDYRIGTYEVTNDQWNKFKASLGVPVAGSPERAYMFEPRFTDTDVPVNVVSWLEAAQFVNWLNTSAGHHVAYNFTGTQGTSDYTFAVWDASEADGGTNLYRHKDALYYLPTQDEWVKAAYWNGTSVQEFATKPGESLGQGDGTSGIGWNFFDDDNSYATDPIGPWVVGSGSEELNGTYDMMGNVWEMLESPYDDLSYGAASARGTRGGCYYGYNHELASSWRDGSNLDYQQPYIGFRIAAEVPEPTGMGLLVIGGIGSESSVAGECVRRNPATRRGANHGKKNTLP